MPTGLSDVWCRLATRVTLRQLLPLSSFVQLLLAFTYPLPVTSRSRAQAFVWFRAKTDKGIVCLADHLHSVTPKQKCQYKFLKVLHMWIYFLTKPANKFSLKNMNFKRHSWDIRVKSFICNILVTWATRWQLQKLLLSLSYLPTPLLGQDMTLGQSFKRSLTGLNSEFSFS